MMIELGPGTNPHPRCNIGIDRKHAIGCEEQDATSGRLMGWSGRLGDGIADEVYASHFMEHIPHGQPLLNVMNEVWRVLRPGGSFTIIHPLVGYTDPYTGAPKSDQIGWQPWADPTHVSYWWYPEALQYFCEGPFKPHADYGIKTWAPLGGFQDGPECDVAINALRHAPCSDLPSFWGVRDGWEGVARLIKP